jgi:hypothetical protein
MYYWALSSMNEINSAKVPNHMHQYAVIQMMLVAFINIGLPAFLLALKKTVGSCHLI